jgi:hypothetical protein
LLNLATETDIERLRQAALLLEQENARLFHRLETLAVELREARGEEAQSLQLEIAQLKEQLASRTDARGPAGEAGGRRDPHMADDAAGAAALFYSLIESAKLCGIKLRAPVVLLALAWAPLPAMATTFFGPSPYLCFDQASIAGCGTSESPFAGTDFSGGYFHLEDFEDVTLDEPGLSASGGFISTNSNINRDSVDEDDGIINGSGLTVRATGAGNFALTAVREGIGRPARGGQEVTAPGAPDSHPRGS